MFFWDKILQISAVSFSQYKKGYRTAPHRETSKFDNTRHLHHHQRRWRQQATTVASNDSKQQRQAVATAAAASSSSGSSRIRSKLARRA